MVASFSLRNLDLVEHHAHEVFGGAYLSPEVYLATNAEITSLREREIASTLPLILGAGVIGLTIGYLLGRRDD